VFVSIPEFIGSGILILLANIAIWAFAWGRAAGKLIERVDNLEDKINDHIDHPPVLSECTGAFLSIAKSLTELKTQMKTVVSEIKTIKGKVGA